MKSDDYCSDCGQKDTCRQAYDKIGKAKGPNVAWKAIVAFLVPIAVFIGVLAGSQRLLQDRFEENILILVSFFLALFVTFVFVCVIRAIHGPTNKDICDKGKVNDGNSR